MKSGGIPQFGRESQQSSSACSSCLHGRCSGDVSGLDSVSVYLCSAGLELMPHHHFGKEEDVSLPQRNQSSCRMDLAIRACKGHL